MDILEGMATIYLAFFFVTVAATIASLIFTLGKRSKPNPIDPAAPESTRGETESEAARSAAEAAADTDTDEAARQAARAEAQEAQ
jgi:hypothetical protein